MTRRLLLAASLLLAALIAGAMVFGFMTSGDPETVWVSLEDLHEREVIHLEKEHVFVVFNEGEPLALSDDAQHVGDTVIFCESSRLFESPAHGEKFDMHGRYFGGPAARGLSRYPVRREGDLLLIDTTKEIKGPPRGEGPALEPAGDYCV